MALTRLTPAEWAELGERLAFVLAERRRAAHERELVVTGAVSVLLRELALVAKA